MFNKPGWCVLIKCTFGRTRKSWTGLHGECYRKLLPINVHDYLTVTR